MKKFKKVYIEITNNCNLQCSFCTINKRKNKNMTLDDFEYILKEIDNYTDYIYLHVLGEPLIHKDINEIIALASKYNKNVNITTNGYFINRINKNKNIRQINISLHSFNNNIKLEEYLNSIFESVKYLSEYTYISYRIWVKNKYTNEIIKYLNQYYRKNIIIDKLKNVKLANNIYLNIHEEFIWPNISNNIYNEKGRCYALKDHIAILVDGTIVPCCLDGDGIIKLGNIYKEKLQDVLNNVRAYNMVNGFKNNIKCEELCKHCNFIKE